MQELEKLIILSRIIFFMNQNNKEDYLNQYLKEIDTKL